MSEAPMWSNLNLARIVARLHQDPRGWAVDDLMSDLGIGERTYRKYRKRLQDHLGELHDAEGGSRIQEVREGDRRWLRLVNQEKLDDERRRALRELAALHLASEGLKYLGDDMVSHLRALGRRARHDTDGVPNAAHLLLNFDRLLHHLPVAPKDYSRHQETIEEVLTALFSRNRLAMRYRAADNEVTEGILEPLTLVLHKSSLYLIARYRGSEKPYIFAVDRFEKVEALDKSYGYPDPASYHPERFTQGNFGIFYEPDGEPTDVKLVFDDIAWLKTYLTERLWHPSQEFEELDDGRLRMTFTVRSMTEVWPWVRSFGEQVEVVAPEEPEPSGE